MVVASCTHESFKKHGKNATGKQRLRCKACGHSWLEDTPQPLGSMRIGMKDATMVLGMLLEGMSIRAASRLTGLHQDTIGDLILTAGENCESLMESIQGVEARDVECDEIWSFVGCKEKNRIANQYGDEVGDAWSWIALESNTKLVLAHRVGNRDTRTCYSLMKRIKEATVGRFQLSSDGLQAYRQAVPFVLGSRVDFGQIVKNYAGQQATTRYSPATIISAEKKARFGNPDFDKMTTSHIERHNLSLRMHVRRFTRLTNAHSKSLKHHEAMLNIFFAWYNWCRINTGLEAKKTTPAMASKLADSVWSIKELLERAVEKKFSATN